MSLEHFVVGRHTIGLNVLVFLFGPLAVDVFYLTLLTN